MNVVRDMTILTTRAAAVAALLHFAVATPAGANVIAGDVNFDETRCPGNCTGSAVNPFGGTNSIATRTATIGTDPVSLGIADFVEGLYLGGNAFGFNFANLTNPSLGGIISGIDLDGSSSEITEITVSYTGEIDNAMLFSAFMPNAVAVFVETADTSGGAITDLSVAVDLAISGASTDPQASVTPVPLPAGLPLALAGLAALGLASRRKPV